MRTVLHELEWMSEWCIVDVFPLQVGWCQVARTFMISICEYSIRDYYGVSNIFYSVLFSSRYNIQLFSYHSKYQFLQVRTLEKAFHPPKLTVSFVMWSSMSVSVIWKRWLRWFLLGANGAIHSTKNSGNFGPKLNGSVRSNQKSFEKTGPVGNFGWMDRALSSQVWALITYCGQRSRKNEIMCEFWQYLIAF